MALTTCQDCGQRVSEAAKACPVCGRPSEAVLRNRWWWRTFALSTFAVVFALAVIGEVVQQAA